MSYLLNYSSCLAWNCIIWMHMISWSFTVRRQWIIINLDLPAYFFPYARTARNMLLLAYLFSRLDHLIFLWYLKTLSHYSALSNSSNFLSDSYFWIRTFMRIFHNKPFSVNSNSISFLHYITRLFWHYYYIHQHSSVQLPHCIQVWYFTQLTFLLIHKP